MKQAMHEVHRERGLPAERIQISKFQTLYPWICFRSSISKELCLSFPVDPPSKVFKQEVWVREDLATVVDSIWNDHEGNEACVYWILSIVHCGHYVSNVIINRNAARTCNRCLMHTDELVEQVVNVALTCCVLAHITRWDDIITRTQSQSAAMWLPSEDHRLWIDQSSVNSSPVLPQLEPYVTTESRRNSAYTAGFVPLYDRPTVWCQPLAVTPGTEVTSRHHFGCNNNAITKTTLPDNTESTNRRKKKCKG